MGFLILLRTLFAFLGVFSVFDLVRDLFGQGNKKSVNYLSIGIAGYLIFKKVK